MEIIDNSNLQAIRANTELGILRHKAKSMEKHAMDTLEEWCNIKEGEQKCLHKIEEIATKYNYLTTLAELKQGTFHNAHKIFEAFWQELDTMLLETQGK